MAEMQAEFEFDYDPCPYPKPDNYDGLEAEWGNSNYVNPPFGGYMDQRRKKKIGPTAWARKAITEFKKGKRVVFVYPIDKWILMFLEAGAQIRNLGNVKWCSIEDGSQGKGTGRWVAMFILEPETFTPSNTRLQPTAYGAGQRGNVTLQASLFAEEPSAINGGG